MLLLAFAWLILQRHRPGERRNERIRATCVDGGKTKTKRPQNEKNGRRVSNGNAGSHKTSRQRTALLRSKDKGGEMAQLHLSVMGGSGAGADGDVTAGERPRPGEAHIHSATFTFFSVSIFSCRIKCESLSFIYSTCSKSFNNGKQTSLQLLHSRRWHRDILFLFGNRRDNVQ
ncbi:hypothetical protein F2P81_003673 [Scophthalmus maximus]|uniref:Secreted protein n=1 Tax=Scophthalmus maximus TaxID=52904 RepID=A0A6A4TH32_SCOMX|nr:hypothetical protein F2P81_003673 [Scophthalmus maximus]